MSTTQAEKRTKSSGTRIRGKNWSDDECVLFAKRWVAVTGDPQKGKDQSREVFWDKVAEQLVDRNGLSCMKTFQRMSLAVQKVFICCFPAAGKKN